jgi:sugar phosphate permease
VQIGFSAVFQALIDKFGWRHAYFALGIIIGSTLLVVCVFYYDSPEDKGLKPDGEPVEIQQVEMT